MSNKETAPPERTKPVEVDGYYVHRAKDVPIVITFVDAKELGAGVHASYHAKSHPIPGGDVTGMQVIYVHESQKFNIQLGNVLGGEQTFVVHSVVRPDILDY